MNLNSAMEAYASIELGQYRDKFFPGSDIMSYYGSIEYFSPNLWKKEIDFLQRGSSREKIPDSLIIVLYTGGGIVESVEKMVDITRRFYSNVQFVIPDMAMSAGTIWAMSGDKIHMNYASSLGPIDPQVQKEGGLVPALGYLDKVDEIIERSANNTVTQAELMLLNQFDVAELSRYKQAVELSVDLLKKWLVKYKFKDWDFHSKTNKPVTEADKIKRAEEIAKSLSDNKQWHSHSRMISPSTLTNELKLKIDDFTDNHHMCNETEHLHQLLSDWYFKANRGVLVLGKPCG